MIYDYFLDKLVTQFENSQSCKHGGGQNKRNGVRTRVRCAIIPTHGMKDNDVKIIIKRVSFVLEELLVSLLPSDP